MLRLHYSEEARDPRGHDAKGVSNVRVETFPLRLADDSWHKLAVIVSGDQIEVIFNMEKKWGRESEKLCYVLCNNFLTRNQKILCKATV